MADSVVEGNQASSACTASNDQVHNNGSDAPTTANESNANVEEHSGEKALSKDTETPDTMDVNESTVESVSSKEPKADENGVLRTTRKADGKDWAKNKKYDASILPETDDPVKIRNQVEFYFSDSNLSTDKGMLKLTDGSSNNPIPISDLCNNFNRMKRFRPREAVVAALKDSFALEVIGDEGEETVRRKKAWKPSSTMAREGRSIYAKGFGDEEAGTQFDIEAFFAPHGPTNNVLLRRSREKLFKGSVFVEFQDEDTFNKFMALDPKPKWQGKHDLVIKSKNQYLTDKNESLRDGSIEPSDTRKPRKTWGGQHNRGGYGRGRDRLGRSNDRRGDHDDRGDRDPDDWRKRREHDRATGFKDDKKRRDQYKGGRRGTRDGKNEDREKSETDVNEEKSTLEGSEGKIDGKMNGSDSAQDKPALEKTEDKKPEARVHNEKDNPESKKRHRDNDNEERDEKPAKNSKIDTTSDSRKQTDDTHG